jgi:hypothetical protein
MTKNQMIFLLIIIVNIIIGLFLIKEYGYLYLIVNILLLMSFIWDVKKKAPDSKV